MKQKEGTNSTCNRCGEQIYCPRCGNRLEIINRRLDSFRKKYSKRFNFDNLPERIKIKVVDLDRRSLFICCRDDNHEYKLTYEKGSVVSAPNTFGISCFDDLKSAAHFLDYMAQSFYNGLKDIITENKYLVLLVRGLGTKHGSVNEAALDCYCSIHLDSFYKEHPVKLYNDYLFSNMDEDDYGIGWTPKGTHWYDKVRVLT